MVDEAQVGGYDHIPAQGIDPILVFNQNKSMVEKTSKVEMTPSMYRMSSDYSFRWSNKANKEWREAKDEEEKRLSSSK